MLAWADYSRTHQLMAGPKIPRDSLWSYGESRLNPDYSDSQEPWSISSDCCCSLKAGHPISPPFDLPPGITLRVTVRDKALTHFVVACVDLFKTECIMVWYPVSDSHSEFAFVQQICELKLLGILLRSRLLVLTFLPSNMQ